MPNYGIILQCRKVIVGLFRHYSVLFNNHFTTVFNFGKIIIVFCERGAAVNAFDGELYMRLQKEQIEKRIDGFDGKLYLEFGGKLFDDYHAARVFPGFSKSSKIELLLSMKAQTEIIFCVNANDLEKTKLRADLGISYAMEVLRLIDEISATGLLVSGVVITRFAGQSSAELFRQKLQNYGIATYLHYTIDRYPADVAHICSEKGFGRNEYIETTKPLVVVTAPGPGSGKLATCLSQIYGDMVRGVRSGYAKFETFPVHNLPLNHPINLAYEAATADLSDINMIDPFHLEKYGINAVNYNRDVEAFPIVRTVLESIYLEEESYHSPTDMGVNMVGFAISDDEEVREAASQEIIRRYYRAVCDNKQGRVGSEVAQKIFLLIAGLKIKPEVRRRVVIPALECATESNTAAAAIELRDGRIITGRASNLMTAVPSCVLNALKTLAGLDSKIHLIPPTILEPILRLKMNMLSSRSSVLKLDDVLTALSIAAIESRSSAKALEQLPRLTDCDMHTTTMLRSGDESILRRLSVRLTSEPEFPSKDLFF